MFHAPAHKSGTAGQVTPGLSDLRRLCDAQANDAGFADNVAELGHVGYLSLLDALAQPLLDPLDPAVATSDRAWLAEWLAELNA